MSQPAYWECSQCKRQVARKGSHPPKGWKRKEEAYFCSTCWQKNYILRAITLPVATPIDCTWEQLNESLKAMWRETTRASNYMMTACFTRDVRREPGVEKMPRMPKLYLYPEARAMFPALPSQSVASLEHAVKGKYSKLRYDVIWTCGKSLPSMRYPTPYPVSGQSWSAFIEDQRPVVSVRIGDQRIRLRLKGGMQFAPLRKQFLSIVKAEAIPGDLAIYRRGDPPKLLVKMVAWLPRAERQDKPEGCLMVRAAADSLLVAVNGKQEAIWKYNADHVRRWVWEHKMRLQRWAEDSKFEHRPVPDFARRRELAVQKFRDRMNSACHQIAACVKGYAERRHFAQVRYDDRNHSYCPDFPWAKLRSLIIEKLDVLGITVIIASDAAEGQKPETLADK